VKLFRGTVAAFLRLAVLSVLLLGSCVGPMVVSMETPSWLLTDVDPEATGSLSFFVALRSEENKESQPIQVIRFHPKQMGFNDARYHLPDGRTSYSWGGDGHAKVDVTTREPGSQLVRVFVTGETLSSSLSEYRVVDGTLQPLRHARSSPWPLLGIPVCLLVLYIFWKPLRRGLGRGTDRLLGVEPSAARPNGDDIAMWIIVMVLVALFAVRIVAAW
jgi:hypothetical protein